MNILVTGAMGNIGIRVIKKLVNEGHNVTAFDMCTKKNTRKSRSVKKVCRIVWGDILHVGDVKKAVRGADKVIHLAAIIPPAAEEHPEASLLVNIEGTANIISACLKSENNPWLLFSSSISIYGDRRKTDVIKTTDMLMPNDNYAEHKLECEKMIQNSSGLDWQIYRLSAIFSTDNLKLVPYMFRMPLDTSLEICTAEDVAHALTEAVNHSELLGTINNIAGGASCRTDYRRFITKMLGLFGFGKKRTLPDSAFCSEPFHCGYMDTGEAASILKYQRHSLADFYREVWKKFRLKRILVKLFRPVAMKILKSKSPYLRKKQSRTKIQVFKRRRLA